MWGGLGDCDDVGSCWVTVMMLCTLTSGQNISSVKRQLRDSCLSVRLVRLPAAQQLGSNVSAVAGHPVAAAAAAGVGTDVRKPKP